MNIQSLCILRLSAIGDVCHAVAMVERIQRVSPHIAITWIIGKVEYQLVKDLPGIEFVVFDKKLGTLASLRQLKENLRGRHFDALFLMQVALRANIASLCIRARYRFGFDAARSKEMHSLFVNRRIAAQRHSHVLSGFMGFADAAGIPDAGDPAWHIPVPDADEQWAQAHTPDVFIVINPSASKNERNWSAECYAKVADYFSERGVKTVLTGGPAEAELKLGHDVEQAMGRTCINLIGKTSLKQLLAVLGKASLVIAPDTGPAHMATAVGTPVVGLYAHSNPRRTGPFNSLQYTASAYDELVAQQRGKPWQELPWGTRVKGDDLMTRIDVRRVITLAEDALSS